MEEKAHGSFFEVSETQCMPWLFGKYLSNMADKFSGIVDTEELWQSEMNAGFESRLHDEKHKAHYQKNVSSKT